MIKFSLTKAQDGFSLLEVLAAILIIGISLPLILGIISSCQQQIYQAHQELQFFYQAKNLLEYQLAQVSNQIIAPQQIGKDSQLAIITKPYQGVENLIQIKVVLTQQEQETKLLATLRFQEEDSDNEF